MRKVGRLLLSLISVIILLSACNMPQTGGQGSSSGDIETKVAATLIALTQSAPQVPLDTPTLASPKDTDTPLVSPTASVTPIPDPGGIEGNISGYPYGSIPALVIVAYGQEPPYNYSYLILPAGSTSYSMFTTYLIPGKWQVVAYDSSGNSGGCPGLVTVISKQTVTCDITDWAASYRAKPAGVPNP
ncbi:MAG TPA: hypothetical protein VMC09_15920 [Anaerolineales bacterium]|nr:hypothetical protein [Anaerolineales bacterium]